MTDNPKVKALSRRAVTGNSELIARIQQRIEAAPHRRITFADYMDWALYDPTYGYYATNQVQIGVRGDFFTAPHLGPDFGELLARQFQEMWQILGNPQPFTLVEMGAGQGLIAMDVLRYLHRQTQGSSPNEMDLEFWAALDYVIVEKAAALIAEQQENLKAFRHPVPKVRWSTFQDLAPDSITGCFFSNELLDALPVHQVVVHGGQLQEVYVTTGPQQTLQEVLGPESTPHLSAYLVDQGIDFNTYPDGYRTEINLNALDWLSTVAQALKQGYLLTIDYGYTAAQYYSLGRAQGTLQCYREHAHHNDPYADVGKQDITAHVNFTALVEQGQQMGLDRLGWTQQAPFLMALGLGDRLVANNTRENLADLSQILRRRDAIHALMNPLGLGGFQVLVQTKGLSDSQQQQGIQGLRMLPI